MTKPLRKTLRIRGKPYPSLDPGQATSTTTDDDRHTPTVSSGESGRKYDTHVQTPAEVVLVAPSSARTRWATRSCWSSRTSRCCQWPGPAASGRGAHPELRDCDAAPERDGGVDSRGGDRHPAGSGSQHLLDASVATGTGRHPVPDVWGGVSSSGDSIVRPAYCPSSEARVIRRPLSGCQKRWASS